MGLISSRQLHVNQSIEIEVKKGAYKGNFQSKIEEINDDNIKILPPVKKGEIIPLRKNTEINIFFTGKDAAYKFYSQVIDRIKEQVKLLVIEPPEEIVRIQRRNYFRLNLKKDLEYRILDENYESEEDFRKTQTIDLSGGGVRMVIEEEEVEKGDILEIKLDIPEIEEISIIGEVKQIYDLPNGKSAGIEFTQIPRQIRDHIISWLFDYQRELRKKGLL